MFVFCINTFNYHHHHHLLLFNKILYFQYNFSLEFNILLLLMNNTLFVTQYGTYLIGFNTVVVWSL